MLSCSEYDYIEIVCMFNYPINVTMKTGKVIKCIALDTQRNEASEECMKVKVDGVETSIGLDEISKLEISIRNPHFDEVNFGDQAV